MARLEEELSTAHALGHSLQSELHSLRAGLHSDQDSVKQEVTVLSTRLAEQVASFTPFSQRLIATEHLLLPLASNG